MQTRLFLKLMGTSALASLLAEHSMAQDAPGPVVRLADLEIDPAQLQAFMEASRANVQTSLRVEPGVLALHAVSEKGKPTRIRVFEMYADPAAYRAHLQTPHFQKFRAGTDAMITARSLLETVPVRLGAKPQIPAQAQVRIAELEIAPAQLDAYIAAVTVEIDASIRLEPGVLAIYAVTLKDRPNHLRVFEIYADEAAYQAHIASPHFKTYVEVTKTMITSRKLFETDLILLGQKAP